MRASAFCWPRSVLPAWGEPARPGFPPEGETGKGATPLLVPAGVPQQTRAALIPRSHGISQRLRAASIRSPQSI
jgi:hypothetical protein